MSLVPARIATYLGFRSRTSRRNLASICEVTCPLIPRPTILFFAKKSPGVFFGHASVMESPISTARGGLETALFASAYLPKFAQSPAASAAAQENAESITAKSIFFICVLSLKSVFPPDFERLLREDPEQVG